jgi:hypothetical protein
MALCLGECIDWVSLRVYKYRYVCRGREVGCYARRLVTYAVKRDHVGNVIAVLIHKKEEDLINAD